MKNESTNDSDKLELKEVISSFKLADKINVSDLERAYVYLSENFPEYRLIHHCRINNSTVELQDDKSQSLFESFMDNPSALCTMARVLLVVRNTHNAIFKYRLGRKVYFTKHEGSPVLRGVIRAQVLRQSSDRATVLPHYKIEEMNNDYSSTTVTFVALPEERISLSAGAFNKAYLEHTISDLKNKVADYEAELNKLCFEETATWKPNDYEEKR